MEKKGQIKIKLKSLLIPLIIIASAIIVGNIYITNILDTNIWELIRVRSGIYKEDNVESDDDDEKEIQGVYRIKGENSNLLYKNDYESGTAYLEKVIYLDEESKKEMTGILNADEALYIGNLKGNYIDVKYTSKLEDYETSLAYMSDDNFYNCKTNNVIRNALDKNGNKTEIPQLSEDYTAQKPNQNLKFYTIYDVNTKNNENYVVIMYDETFENTNSNIVIITVVLKNENFLIDINNENQIEEILKKYTDYEIENVSTKKSKNYEKIQIKDNTYYHKLNEKTWNGKYHKDQYEIASSISMQKVVSYKEYLKCIDEINSKIDLMINKTDDLSLKEYYKKQKLSNYYKNSMSNYIVLGYSDGRGWCTMELIDCTIKNNKIIIYGDENVNGVMASGSGYFIAIPTDMPVGTTVEYRECYSTSEIKNLQNYGNAKGSKLFMTVDKPIIYLYPEKDTQLNVKLEYAELATCLYPEYNYQLGWNVFAKNNGDLIDLNTNRNLYALYYECKNRKEFCVTDEGFIVNKRDITKFLEDKLAILGLNDREAEEFIIYWLPKLQENEYNYIRFASIDEINENMPLKFSQEPDTLIRVLMTYKGLSEPINVKEQQLEKVERKGFVVVEWGGSEIK